MRDDFESAVWADNHHHLSRGLQRFFHKLYFAFKRLNAIEYDAPWRYMRP